MVSSTLIRHVLLAALRDKVITTLVLLIVLGSTVSLFFGAAAVTEEQTFTVVLAAGGLRFVGAIALTLFICFYVRRAFDHKEVEFMLSRPISRGCFLLSHAAAFIFLAVTVALAVSGAVAVIGFPPFEGLLAWGGSILVEYALVSIVALFFSMVLTSAASAAMAGLALYVLGRLIGTLLGIAQSPQDGFVFSIMAKVMELVSIIIPRLDAMGQTTWLVYGAPADLTDLWKFAAQSVVLMGLFLSASAFDLSRRQF